MHAIVLMSALIIEVLVISISRDLTACWGPYGDGPVLDVGSKRVKQAELRWLAESFVIGIGLEGRANISVSTTIRFTVLNLRFCPTMR